MPTVTITPKDMSQVSSTDLISEFISRTHTALWTGMTVILLVPIAEKGLETGLATQFTHSIVCRVVATSLIGGLFSFGFDGVDYFTKTTYNAALNWGKKKLKLSCDRVSVNIPTLWHRASPSTRVASSTEHVSNTSPLPQKIPCLSDDELENKHNPRSTPNPSPQTSTLQTNSTQNTAKKTKKKQKKITSKKTTTFNIPVKPLPRSTINLTENFSKPPKQGILRRVAEKMTEILKDTLLREC